MTGRTPAVASVLATVAALGLRLAAERRHPFDGRDLGRTQVETLFLIAHAAEPMTPGVVATALGITPGAVTQLVDGLRSAGLVASVRNPADARSRILALTPEATAQVERFEREAGERLSPVFRHLDDGDLETLSALMRRLEVTP